jgi:hypothetical protein
VAQPSVEAGLAIGAPSEALAAGTLTASPILRYEPAPRELPAPRLRPPTETAMPVLQKVRPRQQATFTEPTPDDDTGNDVDAAPATVEAPTPSEPLPPPARDEGGGIALDIDQVLSDVDRVLAARRVTGGPVPPAAIPLPAAPPTAAVVPPELSPAPPGTVVVVVPGRVVRGADWQAVAQAIVRSRRAARFAPPMPPGPVGEPHDPVFFW